MENSTSQVQKPVRISVRFADEYDAKSFITDFLLEDMNYNFTVKQETDDIIQITFEKTSANETDWVINDLRKECKECGIHGLTGKRLHNHRRTLLWEKIIISQQYCLQSSLQS